MREARLDLLDQAVEQSGHAWRQLLVLADDEGLAGLALDPNVDLVSFFILRTDTDDRTSASGHGWRRDSG
jgi:hypothetical protein